MKGNYPYFCKRLHFPLAKPIIAVMVISLQWLLIENDWSAVTYLHAGKSRSLQLVLRQILIQSQAMGASMMEIWMVVMVKR